MVTAKSDEPISFGDANGLTATIPGNIRLVACEYLMFVGYSRPWVLLIMELHIEDDLALQLIEYRPETHSTIVHNLEVPQNLKLSTITNIALDDHRGDALLINSSGVLFRVSYV
jgi:hypothetical protein